jgi:hypothetical protein
MVLKVHFKLMKNLVAHDNIDPLQPCSLGVHVKEVQNSLIDL